MAVSPEVRPAIAGVYRRFTPGQSGILKPISAPAGLGLSRSAIGLTCSMMLMYRTKMVVYLVLGTTSMERCDPREGSFSVVRTTQSAQTHRQSRRTGDGKRGHPQFHPEDDLNMVTSDGMECNWGDWRQVQCIQ